MWHWKFAERIVDMGKKDTPPPPDYVGAAEATARANRPDQNTPWGSVDWTEGPGGDWTQNITLSPEQQAALDSQQRITAGKSDLAEGMLGRMEGEFSQPMDWSQFNDWTTSVGGGEEARKAAEGAYYDKATSRLDPRWQEKNQFADSKLRAQGLRPGDEAYDRQMAELGRQETDAYDQAQMSAILTGGREGERSQGMDIAGGAFGNTARGGQIAETMQKRGFSLNEINAILTGQQIGLPQFPGFKDGPDYSGAARDTYSADMDAYNADNALMNSIYAGLGNAAPFAFGGGG